MGAISPGALLSAYLLLTLGRLLTGDARPDATLLMAHCGLLAVALLSTILRDAPRWLVDWIPIVAIPLLYWELPGVIAIAGHAPRESVVMAWESALFGHPAATWAASVPSTLFSEVLHLGYLSYYALVPGIAAALTLTGRERDRTESVFVLLLGFVACFVAYWQFPVDGPRYSGAIAAPDGPFRTAVTWLLERGSSRGTAFPSSHAAIAVTQAVLAIRYFGKRGTTVTPIAIALCAGAVYGGFHYAIDVVAGILLGLATTFGGLFAFGRLARGETQANASAPT